MQFSAQSERMARCKGFDVGYNLRKMNDGKPFFGL